MKRSKKSPKQADRGLKRLLSSFQSLEAAKELQSRCQQELEEWTEELAEKGGVDFGTVEMGRDVFRVRIDDRGEQKKEKRKAGRPMLRYKSMIERVEQTPHREA